MHVVVNMCTSDTCTAYIHTCNKVNNKNLHMQTRMILLDRNCLVCLVLSHEMNSRGVRVRSVQINGNCESYQDRIPKCLPLGESTRCRKRYVTRQQYVSIMASLQTHYNDDQQVSVLLMRILRIRGSHPSRFASSLTITLLHYKPG